MRASVYESREAIVIMIDSQFTGMGVWVLLDYRHLYRAHNGTARIAQEEESSNFGCECCGAAFLLYLDADNIAPRVVKPADERAENLWTF